MAGTDGVHVSVRRSDADRREWQEDRNGFPARALREHAHCPEAIIAVADPTHLRFSRDALAPPTCEVEPHRDAAHVVPTGEIDIAVAPTVDARITELRDAGFRRLLLDLRQVTFLDVCALRVILKWADAARVDPAATFVVIPGPAHVQRIFTLTRTADRIDFVSRGPAAAGQRGRRR